MRVEDKAQLGYLLLQVDETEAMKRLRRAWLEERTRIINAGKKHRKEEDWAELDGFDKALKVYEGAIDAALKAKKETGDPGYVDPLEGKE